ncbi:MAG: sugar ABC transporter permease [Myxococcota bacterium]|nr:sugar ABC transporter permease [Myxococcota bacterium]
MRRPSRQPCAAGGRWTGPLLVAPSLLLFGIFFLYPVIYCFWLSLQSWDMLLPPCPVGLDNYRRLLVEGELLPVLGRTLAYSLASLGVTLGGGLLLALALQRPGRSTGLLQGLVFSSYVVSWVGVSLLWTWMLDPTSGIVNRLLLLLGVAGPDWLGDPTWALVALIGVTAWKTVGYSMVVFLAGLQSIPTDLYEAAALDGATPWQRFWRITWPLLRPTTIFLTITTFILSFQAFDVVRVMTQGGPARSTTIYVYYIWEAAFLFFDAGGAAAATILFFVVILGLTVLQWRFAGQRTGTGEEI